MDTFYCGNPLKNVGALTASNPLQRSGAYTQLCMERTGMFDGLVRSYLGNRSLSDVMQQKDIFTEQTTRARSITEIFANIDNVTPQKMLVRTLLESAGYPDTVNRQVVVYRSLVESMNAPDSSGKQGIYIRIPLDYSPITDHVDRVIRYGRTLADVMAQLDNFGYTYIPAAGTHSYYATYSEAFTLIDIYGRQPISFIRQFVDAAEFLDSITIPSQVSAAYIFINLTQGQIASAEVWFS